jgi:hypothetical protein
MSVVSVSKGSVSPRTYKNYKNYVKKFEEFIGHNEVYFDDITVTTLNDYVNYLSNKLKNGNTTIRYSLNILAIMFKDAIREEIISLNTYPFASVRIKKAKSTRLFLNKEQIEQLKNHKSSFGQTDTYFRDMFIFLVMPEDCVLVMSLPYNGKTTMKTNNVSD